MDLKAKLPRPVDDAIVSLVRREMAPFGLRGVTAAAGRDHDGDEVIYIDTEYEPQGPAIDLSVANGMIHKLCDKLWEMGEIRFPLVRHHFPEQRAYVGFS